MKILTLCVDREIGRHIFKNKKYLWVEAYWSHLIDGADRFDLADKYNVALSTINGWITRAKRTLINEYVASCRVLRSQIKEGIAETVELTEKMSRHRQELLAKMAEEEKSKQEWYRELKAFGEERQKLFEEGKLIRAQMPRECWKKPGKDYSPQECWEFWKMHLRPWFYPPHPHIARDIVPIPKEIAEMWHKDSQYEMEFRKKKDQAT